MARKKVLITGAAGSIGKVMRQGLQDRYDLRLMYHRTVLPAAAGEEVFVCGITELETLEEGVDGVDAIIHMAGDPRVDAPWAMICSGVIPEANFSTTSLRNSTPLPHVG